MMRRRCASVYVSLLLLGFRVTAMGQSSASSSHPVAAGGATGRSCERRKLLGWDGQIGALESGYLADVIAVTGDPLQDIGTLQNVSFVMKGGVIYKK